MIFHENDSHVLSYLIFVENWGKCRKFCRLLQSWLALFKRFLLLCEGLLFLYILTPHKRQPKTLILSTNVDTCNKSFSRNSFRFPLVARLVLASFDPRSSIVKYVFDCRLSGIIPLTEDKQFCLLVADCLVVGESQCSSRHLAGKTLWNHQNQWGDSKSIDTYHYCPACQ